MKSKELKFAIKMLEFAMEIFDGEGQKIWKARIKYIKSITYKFND